MTVVSLTNFSRRLAVTWQSCCSYKPKGLSFQRNEVEGGKKRRRKPGSVWAGGVQTLLPRQCAKRSTQSNGSNKRVATTRLCMCEKAARTAGNLKGNDLHRAKQ